MANEYDHVNDAAAAALMRIQRQPRADEIEYAAWLLRNPNTGKYSRSGFMTNFDPGGVTLRPELAAGYDIVGTAHNHPYPGADFPNHLFSEYDQRVAELAGPAFLAPMLRGTRPTTDRRFDENSKTANLRGRRSGRSRRVGIGDEFLAKFPIKELLEHIAQRNPMMAAYLSESANGRAARR